MAEENGENKNNEVDNQGGEANNSNQENANNNEAPDFIKEAKEINKEKAKLLDREEAIEKSKNKRHAEQMLGGRSVAGKQAEKQTEDQKKVSNAKEMFKGTALGDAITQANG